MASESGTVKLFGIDFALQFSVLVVLMRDSNWVSPKLPRGFYE